MTLIQTEPKKIRLGVTNYGTQGPCTSGYHVPSKDENIALVAAMISLGIDTSNGNCMKTYLKMPFAGYRHRSSGSTSLQDDTAFYWSSSIASDDAYNASNMAFNSTTLKSDSGSGSYRSFGMSIRPFKNTPSVPDNTWTTLYGTLSGGIFMKSGLISISSDGNNWITIADKNLGATTVYNDGDTLAEANCGKYYQRGNNNGFAWTGSVTTSNTKVDASTYGPGNYYSSSTFITTSASPNDRSSVQNDNLRGGVDTPIKKVTIRPNGTEKQIRPVIPPYLCFTANTASSTVKLNKIGSPGAISLETSVDAKNWTVYTIGSTITLSNVGDRIYMRNTSETPVNWGGNGSYYYQFAISGSVAASGDINYLLCKNSTSTTIAYCYINLFYGCTGLTSAPELPATEAKEGCYRSMFFGCTGLTEAPGLPFTSVERVCCFDMFNGCTNLTSIPLLKPTSFVFQCCRNMFSGCSKIKLSTTQTGEYQTEYRIPTTGTGSMSGEALYNMFGSTGGTFTGTPTINTTYYTSNTLV